MNLFDLGTVFDAHEPVVAQRLAQVLAQLRARLRPRLREAIASRNYAALVDLVRGIAGQLAEEVLLAYLAAGRATAQHLTTTLGIPAYADPTHWRATQSLQDTSNTLTQSLVEDQMRAITLIARDAESEGRGADDTAEWILMLLGLSSSQVAQVIQYRYGLMTTRPRRPTTEAEERRGPREVTTADVDRMVRGFVLRRHDERSRVVVDAEVIRAIHRAQLDVLYQAVDERLLNAFDIVRMWLDVGDGKVRESHRAMRGQARNGLTDPFLSGYGNLLLYPGDPSAPIKDWVECRCRVRVGIRT